PGPKRKPGAGDGGRSGVDTGALAGAGGCRRWLGMRAEMGRLALIATLAVALGTAYMMAVLPAVLAYAAVLRPDAGPQIVFAMDRLPEPGEPVHVQAAVASWYGHPFIGRTTASGST